MCNPAFVVLTHRSQAVRTFQAECTALYGICDQLGHMLLRATDQSGWQLDEQDRRAAATDLEAEPNSPPGEVPCLQSVHRCPQAGGQSPDSQQHRLG